ncbi:hypothetical protein [Sphingomonas sp. LY160]|uniref:hypothetical protein n=1 Tax=Sphingomonas sp. LY160 TaxID=3095342 RepID=UPI002ADECE8E|nr:hypothetical protein [Sphingomonas sp. LY160]MEA1072143.1 hypothetical protein [Sphingomonas sp. LY160]
MRKELGELRDTYRQVGGRRFWAIVIPLVVWALAGVWLDGAVTWPTQCDVSGAGDLGYVQKLGCSARLLSGGGAEIGMFVWLWALPALAAIGLIWFAIIRRKGPTAP